MNHARRTLVAPLNADHPQRGMIGGFRKVLGEENVVEFDFLALRRAGFTDDRINGHFVRHFADKTFDFAFLHLQTTDVLTGNAIRQAKIASPKTVFAHWMGDWRPSVAGELPGICAACDLTLVSNDGQHDLYRAAGAERVEYLQIGLDWEEDVLGEPPFDPPFRVPAVVFCGNFYLGTFPGSGDRLRAILALQEAEIDVGVVGSGWPDGVRVVGACGVKQQHHVYKRAKVALSISNINDCRRYYSDRQLISMASRTPVVCKYIPDLEKEFCHGVECLFYDDEAQLVGHVRNLLQDEHRRQQIGVLGQDKVVKQHTWEARIRRDLLPKIELLRERRR